MAFEPHLPEIAGVIQLAIAPVFMLTAVGTVINALNMRLGRMAPEELPSARDELATIARRIRFVYLSIVFAVSAPTSRSRFQPCSSARCWP